MTIVCKNCGNHFKGHFCSNCGQKATAGRLRTKHVVHEVWHNFTHTDKGYLSLLKQMIVRPGIVIREYIDAKRKKYFNPYTFFLVTTAILIFLTAKVFAYEDELYQYKNEYGQYLNLHYNIIVLCSMPVVALLLQLIFLKKRFNYAEWVTMMVFTFGLINFFQCLMQFVYFPLIKYHYAIKSYALLFGYGIFLYVLIRFIEPKKWWEWLQCIFATVIVFYFIELFAQLIALGLWNVPVSKLVKMFKESF